jgi:hypothetical protein
VRSGLVEKEKGEAAEARNRKRRKKGITARSVRIA